MKKPLLKCKCKCEETSNMMTLQIWRNLNHDADTVKVMGSYICCEHISYETSNMRLQIWCKCKNFETISMMQAPQIWWNLKILCNQKVIRPKPWYCKYDERSNMMWILQMWCSLKYDAFTDKMKPQILLNLKYDWTTKMMKSQCWYRICKGKKLPIRCKCKWDETSAIFTLQKWRDPNYDA